MVSGRGAHPGGDLRDWGFAQQHLRRRSCAGKGVWGTSPQRLGMDDRLGQWSELPGPPAGASW